MPEEKILYNIRNGVEIWFSTMINVKGETSPPTAAMRGIEQGDPLSVSLFLSFMDWANEGIGSNSGATFGNETIICHVRTTLSFMWKLNYDCKVNLMIWKYD